MTLGPLTQQRQQAMLVGVALVVLSLFIQFNQIPGVKSLLSRAEGIVYDLRLKLTLTPNQARQTEIIILDLDEKTMQHIGWPWPREKLAQLVQNLADAGAAVIAFDVIFSEMERNPALEVLHQLPADTPHQASLEALVPIMDGDQRFIDSFASTDVLLGYILQHDPMQRGTLPEQVVSSSVPIDDALLVADFSGYVTSLPKFHAASSGEGFINSSPDPDGFLRKSALLYRFNDKLYPSLALEAARLYTLAEQITLSTQVAGHYHHVDGVMLGNELIPTDAEGQVLIPYKGGRGTYPYVSAIDVLNQSVSLQPFQGAVVFVGTSAIGLSDLRATPVGVQYPGVEVHANVLDGLLNPSQLKYVPDWWQAAIAIYLVIIGLVLALMLPLLGPKKMAFTGALMIALTLAGNLLLWQHANMALPLVSSLLLIFFIMAYNISVGFFFESRQRQQIKSIFNQYVPPAHIDKMLSAPEDVSMDGERKELTVLFSDIRSFTSIAETLNANQLKKLLNRYFDPITECIFNHHGTIDKYVGDMVMAFWGAPLDDPKHPENAVKTALAMLAITADLRQAFVEEGLPAIHIGIGINTGVMNVGDMGSTFRRAYTVLGDAVNLGSRLEGLTKFYGVECLVSEFTVAACPNLSFRLIDKVKVKGKAQAVTIYEPLDAALGHESKLTNKAAFDEAYAAYLKQDWQQAERGFMALIQGDMDPLYPLYLDRIHALKHAHLPHDWDGSFTHTSK